MNALHVSMLLIGMVSGCSGLNEAPNAAKGAHASVLAGGWRCSNDPNATIDPPSVGGPMLLGSTLVDSRSVTDAVSFATACPVVLTQFESEKKCRWNNEPPPNFNGAVMTIAYKPSARFTMSIVEPQGESYAIDNMTAVDVDSDGDFDYLEGTFDKKKYFVNFVNGLGNAGVGSGPLEKKYYVQVFYADLGGSDGYLCGSHMPGSLQLKNDIKQGGVGGGTEPGRN